MDKEMKKLLLVSVSVGVFLLVTITVALVVLTPKTQMQETAFTASVPNSQTRYVSNIMSNMPDQINGTDLPVAVVNEEGERQEAIIAADKNDGTRLTIQVPVPPSSGATPEYAQTASVPASAKTAPSAQTAPVQTAPAPAVASRPQAQAQGVAKPSGTASRAALAPKAINDFWIQTGAYPSMVGAEDIRETLATNGLVGIVSIFDNQERDGRTWYRVRLGPYTSEREARHWLAIVKTIDGFDKSEVRQTVRLQ